MLQYFFSNIIDFRVYMSHESSLFGYWLCKSIYIFGTNNICMNLTQYVAAIYALDVQNKELTNYKYNITISLLCMV